MTDYKCRWCKTSEHIYISSGPGRALGPIANSFFNIDAKLPDDFEFPVCGKCEHRVMTPEVLEAFRKFESSLSR